MKRSLDRPPGDGTARPAPDGNAGACGGTHARLAPLLRDLRGCTAVPRVHLSGPVEDPGLDEHLADRLEQRVPALGLWIRELLRRDHRAGERGEREFRHAELVRAEIAAGMEL